MATLFERLIGLNLNESGAADEKMAIHPFAGCLNFYGTGDVTGPNIEAWFGLVGEQRDDTIYLSQLASDAQAVDGRNRWMRTFKDFLYNGEWGTTADPFQIEREWWIMLRQVIIEAGGTPTPIPQYLLDRLNP